MIGAGFDTLLKSTMGLDAASIGSSAIDRAVRERMKACNLTEPQAYWDRLNSSSGEVQELIESVVVPETWFFRHPEAFAAMVRIVEDEWRQSEGVLRILSVPCSTGEEPFSIAMALLNAGFPATRFRIDAVDISRRALSIAERANYGRNSFRGDDLSFRDRYFSATPAGYQLVKSVSRHVRFQNGNLLDPCFLPGAAAYDLIFCRNMLIYFDSATQDRAVAVLGRLLSDKGAVFVGPSEGNLLLDHDFLSARVPRAFAFRVAARSGVVEPTIPRHEPIAFRARHAPAPPLAAKSHEPVPQSRPSPSAEAPTIDQIRRLADRGHLAEAARLCEELLANRTASPEVFHLLGLIREAAGNGDEAAACYRKTLYLQPTHHEALAHLALLLQRQGDGAGARILNDRLRRLGGGAGE